MGSMSYALPTGANVKRAGTARADGGYQSQKYLPGTTCAPSVASPGHMAARGGGPRRVKRGETAGRVHATQVPRVVPADEAAVASARPRLSVHVSSTRAPLASSPGRNFTSRQLRVGCGRSMHMDGTHGLVCRGMDSISCCKDGYSVFSVHTPVTYT